MPHRIRRLLLGTVVVVIAGLATATAASASGSGCTASASRLDYHVITGSVYGSGHGEFSCTGPIQSVQYRVSVSYRFGPAFIYTDLPDPIGWVALGDLPGPGATPVFSLDTAQSATTCGQYLIRPEIRWMYPGSSDFTYSEMPVNVTPNCA